MTAAARRSSRRKAKPPPVESFIYDGSRLLGRIVPKACAFVARSATGRAIGGSFASERMAMKAICTADLLERRKSEAQGNNGVAGEVEHA